MFGCPQRLLFVMACALSCLVLACSDEPLEPPAEAAVDSGVELADVTEPRLETIEAVEMAHEVTVDFVGGYDPARGFWLETETLRLGDVELDTQSGDLRTLTQAAAAGFCPQRVTAGGAEGTVTLGQLPGTYGTHLDGPQVRAA